MHRGAGLHRLGFPVELDVRNSINAGVPLVLSGQVWLGQHRSDWLGTLTTEKPVVTYAEPFSARLLLALGDDDQLAVIEQRRAGADFVFGVDVDVVLGYDPAVADVADPSDRWPAKSDQYPLHVHRETWVRMLAQVDAGTSLAIVVPTPFGTGAHGDVGRHLREAIRKINNGEYDDAVTEARKAIDVMDAGVGARPSERALAQKGAHERTLAERLHLLRHAVHSLASPAAHGDANAKTFTWNRETALAVVASIAAIVACPWQDGSAAPTAP